MSKKKKIIIFIIILILLILILRLTYSKYVGEAATGIVKRIAKWDIKVNGTDITEPLQEGEVIKRFNIDNFEWNWDEVTHVSRPMVAPGMKGYFELIIDYGSTEVSTDYTVTINKEAIDEANDIRLALSGLIVNGEPLELPTGSGGSVAITGTKYYNDIKSGDKVDNIKVEVIWENDDQHNEEDSNVGSVQNTTILLPIKVNFKQHTGT